MLTEWDTPVWEHDLSGGLRLLRLAIDTHLITSHYALKLLIRRPSGLLVEMTDGTADYNLSRYRLSTFYDWPRARSYGWRSPRATSSPLMAAPPWRSHRAGCARR